MGPLSPYLFLLCAEALSSKLFLDEGKRLFHRIKISRRSPPVSHLFFADDCNVYFKCTLAACQSIAYIFREYSSASGQIINFSKSGLYVSPNVDPHYAALFHDVFDIVSIPLLQKYLGAPFILSRSKTQSFLIFVRR